MQAIGYSICNALMIVAIRELYIGETLTFMATATISTVAYIGFLLISYKEDIFREEQKT